MILNNHPIPRLAIFVFGTYCPYIFCNDKIGILKNSFNSKIISITSFIFIFIALYLSPKHWNLLDFGILAPLYFIFVLSLTNINVRFRNFLSNKYFIYTGDISYEIYILQFPVHLFFVFFIADTLDFKWFALYLTALLTISILCYELIDSPLRLTISKLFLSK